MGTGLEYETVGVCLVLGFTMVGTVLGFKAVSCSLPSLLPSGQCLSLYAVLPEVRRGVMEIICKCPIYLLQYIFSSYFATARFCNLSFVCCFFSLVKVFLCLGSCSS